MRQILSRIPAWLPRWLGRLAVALAGGVLGLMLAGHVTHDVGPFQARVSYQPSLGGGATVRVPPLGSLGLHVFRGPVGLEVDLAQLRQAEAERLLREPARLAGVGDRAADDVKSALIWLTVKCALAAVIAAVLLSLLLYRRRREAAISAGIVVVAMAAVGGTGVLTWDPARLTEPRYTGLLTNAPALVGSARDVVNRFDIYRRELGAFVTNVSKIYATSSKLPTYQPDSSTIRVLHVSDLHLNPSAFNVIASVERQFKVNFIVDTGDITDWGSGPETAYVRQIRRLKVRYVFIAGNHDSARTAAAVARQPNAIVLDGTKPATVDGLTIVGTRDPRFTPDKRTRDDDAPQWKVKSAGRRLARLVASMRRPPQITLVHDPLSAEPLEDKVPLVLAGHWHKREKDQLDKTLLLVEGSTGGAGLRGLEGEKPTPLECSVLYFNARTHRLEAWDDITLGGLGQTEVTIERHAAPSP